MKPGVFGCVHAEFYNEIMIGLPYNNIFYIFITHFFGLHAQFLFAFLQLMKNNYLKIMNSVTLYIKATSIVYYGGINSEL